MPLLCRGVPRPRGKGDRGQPTAVGQEPTASGSQGQISSLHRTSEQFEHRNGQDKLGSLTQEKSQTVFLDKPIYLEGLFAEKQSKTMVFE